MKKLIIAATRRFGKHHLVQSQVFSIDPKAYEQWKKGNFSSIVTNDEAIEALKWFREHLKEEDDFYTLEEIRKLLGY